MTGEVAGRVGAKVLALNHISSRGDRHGSDYRNNIVKDSQRAAGDSTKVMITYDFMEILVPWLGFGGSNEDDTANNEGDGKDSSSDKQKADVRGAVKQWFG
jgi:hypothetical protein